MGKIFKAKLYPDGRFVVPAKVRKALSIKSGDELRIKVRKIIYSS